MFGHSKCIVHGWPELAHENLAWQSHLLQGHRLAAKQLLTKLLRPQALRQRDHVAAMTSAEQLTCQAPVRQTSLARRARDTRQVGNILPLVALHCLRRCTYA